jgi:hypothetical protein
LDTLQSQEAEPKTPHTKGGIYDRPYIGRVGGTTAIGGYAEMNSNFDRVEGVSEGISFEARRFNIFLYSAISERVKLTSELEFEHGTEEIALETALVDVLFNTAFNLRAGILLSPLGRFNIAHDSPRYDIIERPLVSTRIIPATLSEVGAGFFGALYPSSYDRVSYEIYAVNGLADGVVGGDGAGTRIPAGKSEEAFAEDNNGSPALTGRLAWNPRFGGEIALSGHTGNYNTYKLEGAMVDDRRRLTIVAVDAEHKTRRFSFRGEAAIAKIDVQQSLQELFAEEQRGFYAEAGYTLAHGQIIGFENAKFNAIARLDYVDLNVGRRRLTRENIGDETTRLTVGFAFRPDSDAVIKVNYAREWHYDPLNNKVNSMHFQVGVATYF